jgi:hypothetical protein
MKKIDISNYEIPVDTSDGVKKVPYDVRKSVIGLLFHPEQRLNSVELFENNKIATKIDNCEDDSILLEDAEYARLKKAIETIRGYSRDDIEFVGRILNAETVEVQEKV